MARNKTTQAVANTTVEVQAVEAISYDMGEFAILPYIERKYPAVYFGIRELYGQAAKGGSDKKDFDWKAFNETYEAVFGSVEERKFSIEELGEFAQIYFNKSIEDVIQYNSNSLNRRKNRDNSNSNNSGDYYDEQF